MMIKGIKMLLSIMQHHNNFQKERDNLLPQEQGITSEKSIIMHWFV